jgi:hypothetical protein
VSTGTVAAAHVTAAASDPVSLKDASLRVLLLEGRDTNVFPSDHARFWIWPVAISAWREVASWRCGWVQPGPSLAAASNGTITSLIGAGSPCSRALRNTTPLRMSHSRGRPALRSVRIELVISGGYPR